MYYTRQANFSNLSNIFLAELQIILNRHHDGFNRMYIILHSLNFKKIYAIIEKN